LIPQIFIRFIPAAFTRQQMAVSRCSPGQNVLSLRQSIKITMQIQPIAHFHSPFSSKFGIPKQSGLVEDLRGKIVFEPAYRSRDALRGLEGFDFIWLIWAFSANVQPTNSLVVRPPLLGGNERVGVFASRSPFRPNGLGLSSVRIERIEWQSMQGPVIHVLGADLMNGTPIFDIKPYLSYADSHVGVRCGFVDRHAIRRLEVRFEADMSPYFTAEEQEVLRGVLELDPRPHYQNSPTKIYGMPFQGVDIRFSVSQDGVLTVTEIVG
jgi:methyltransferase, YaeB family